MRIKTLLLAALSSILVSGLAQANLPRIVGSPFYVLEQSTGQNTPEFSLWELRPFERSQNRYSGSRLILTAQGMRIKTFGLAGYQINSEQISVPSVYILDVSGGLYFAHLEEAKTGTRDGRAQWTRIPGQFSALEGEAEDTLFAIRRDSSEIGTLVQLDAAGGVQEIRTGMGKVWKVNRAADGMAPLLATATPSQNPWVDVRSAADYPDQVQWNIRQDMTLERVMDDSSQQSSQLQILSAEQEGEKLTPQSVQILRATRDQAVLRVGGHLVEFSPSQFGTRLSSRILAPGFFGAQLRHFGVPYGLFREQIVLQPRQYDKAPVIRHDIGWRSDGSSGATEGKKNEVSVTGDLHSLSSDQKLAEVKIEKWNRPHGYRPSGYPGMDGLARDFDSLDHRPPQSAGGPIGGLLDRMRKMNYGAPAADPSQSQQNSSAHPFWDQFEDFTDSAYKVRNNPCERLLDPGKPILR